MQTTRHDLSPGWSADRPFPLSPSASALFPRLPPRAMKVGRPRGGRCALGAALTRGEFTHPPVRRPFLSLERTSKIGPCSPSEGVAL